MNFYMIVLRLIHIMGGVFWVGAAWMLAGFIQPTAKAAGPDAAKFMQRLMQSRLSILISVSAVLTVVSGALLYDRVFGTQWRLMVTRAGIGFSLGALAGFIALGIGGGVISPASARMSRLNREIQAAGQPPTPEQMALMGQLQARIASATLWSAIISGIALFFMAIARYL